MCCCCGRKIGEGLDEGEGLGQDANVNNNYYHLLGLDEGEGEGEGEGLDQGKDQARVNAGSLAGRVVIASHYGNDDAVAFPYKVVGDSAHLPKTSKLTFQTFSTTLVKTTT